jgi:short-subunit dehydrogenase
MLKQDIECHIVNTASMAGLISRGLPGLGVYRVTKHGIVSLSETLYYELAERSAKIGVSVLCPGPVNTLLAESERNRPAELQNISVSGLARPEAEASGQALSQAIQGIMSPQQVTDIVFNAIREARFYILTHPDWKPLIQQRLGGILDEHNPS